MICAQKDYLEQRYKLSLFGDAAQVSASEAFEAREGHSEVEEDVVSKPSPEPRNYLLLN